MPLTTVDYAGRSLDQSPRHTLAAGYTLTVPVGNAGSVAASIRSRWTDRYVLSDFAAAIQYLQPGYHTTDATLSYAARHDAWYLQGYVHNIENAIALTGLSGYIAGVGGYGTITEPRTVGVSGGLRF